MRAIRRVLAAALVMAAAAMPCFLGSSGCTHRVEDTSMAADTPLPDLAPVGLKRLWERQLRLEPGERIKKAWRVGTSVYVTSNKSRIARLDASSGTLMWGNFLGEENFDVYKPIELKPAQGPATDVLVVTRGELFVFNMLTGDIVRAEHLGLSVSANPVLIGNILCVGGAGKFFGLYFDRPNGHRWVFTEPGDLFDSTPVAVDNSVVVASKKGHLWRINSDNGDWIWKDRKTNGDVVAGLAADDNNVYVPSLDQRVYAFELDKGGEVWERQLIGTLETTPAFAGPLVLVVSSDRGLYGLARSDGAIKWEAAGVIQVATIGENSAWVGDMEGNLKSISLQTGEVLKSARAEGVQIFVRNPQDQNVILVTRAGLVGMFGPQR